jgi:hypothetical protein
MLSRRGGTHPTTRPLRCDRCHRLRVDSKITVEPTVQKRLKDGRCRDHVHVYCSNGHSWWSVHPEALRRSSEADRHAGQNGG